MTREGSKSREIGEKSQPWLMTIEFFFFLFRYIVKYCCVLLNSFNAEYYLWSQYRVVYTEKVPAIKENHDVVIITHIDKGGSEWSRGKYQKVPAVVSNSPPFFSLSLTLTQNPRKHRMNREQRQQPPAAVEWSWSWEVEKRFRGWMKRSRKEDERQETIYWLVYKHIIVRRT